MIDYIVIVATVVGLIVGIIQIGQYIQSRRNKHASLDTDLRIESKYFLSNLPNQNTFIGRNIEVSVLIDAINQDENRLIVIQGPGGIGKTSIALYIANYLLSGKGNNIFTKIFPFKRQRKKQKFDSYVWITAKANPVSLENALDIISLSLGYKYILQLQDTPNKQSEILRLLRLVKTFIIFDNIETISDERILQFINSIPKPSKVIITTRHQHLWDTKYFLLNLGKLHLEEGLQLIHDEAVRLNLIGLTSIKRETLVELVNVAGGSPLAIKWAVGQIALSGQTLESVVEQIQIGYGSVFETIFHQSWKLLSEESKRLLQIMPLFASNISKEALQSVSGLKTETFHSSLAQLIQLSLVESNNDLYHRKFNIHPLTRVFAQKSIKDVDTHIYRIRICQYYLKFVSNRYRLQLGLEGYDEIEDEIQNLLLIIDWLSETCNAENKNEICSLLIEINDVINTFLWTRGYWSYRIQVSQKTLNASLILEDWVKAGQNASFIGIVNVWQSHLDTAQSWASKSEEYMSKSNNPLDKILVLRLQGLIHMQRGEYQSAIEKHEYVLKIVTSLTNPLNEKNKVDLIADWYCDSEDGYKVGIVSIMQELGIMFNKKGEYPKAIEWLSKSENLADEIGDIEGMSISLSHLGYAYAAQQDIETAKIKYTQGLSLATKVNRQSTIGRCNQGLAHAALVENDRKNCVKYSKVALDIFERLGMNQEKKDIETLLFSLDKQ